MGVEASARSDGGDRRRRRLRMSFLGAVLSLGLGTVGCSATTEAGSPSPSAGGTPGAGAADVAPVPIGTLDQRPVLAVLPPGVASGADVLDDASGTMSYQVGPRAERRPALLSVTAVQSPTGEWQVQPVFAPGADGIDLFNEQARMCHATGPECPTGQLAIVVDGTVASAPRIEPDQTTFTPLSADQISIGGGMTKAEAQALAEALAQP